MSLGLSLRDMVLGPQTPVDLQGVRDNLPTMAPAPKKGSMLLGIIADALAGAAGKAGPYAAMLQQQRQQENEQAQWGLKRTAALEDYRAQKRIDQEFPANKAPYRQQDNAGNVWEQQPDGNFKRIFTDTTPRSMVVDGMMINVPNPYASAPPAPPTARPAIGSVIQLGTGGAGGNASGNFRPRNY